MGLQTVFDNFALLVDAPNGVTRLRELILHLAFRGKLVRQIPAEGTARSVLKKIQSLRGHQNGKSAKNQKQPDVPANEKPHNIPPAWEWVRLGDVVDYDCAQKVAPGQIASDAWLLDLEDIEKDSSRVIQKLTFANRQSKSNKGKFEVNDVLYGKLRPYLNKVIVADEDGYCTTEIVALRGYFGIEPKYLMYALKRPDFISYINAKSYGVKMPRLGRDDARLSVFPLPPLEEQERIVAKVDELMRLCDELEARQQTRRESRERLNNVTLAPLNNVASLAPEEFEQASVRLAENFAALYDSADTVGRLRSTILQLAVQGKLVRQDTSDEPASSLLERIAKKKRKLLEQKAIRPFPEFPIDPNLREQIPLAANWKWSTVLDVALLVTDGEHATPPRVARPDIPLATAKNVRNESLDLEITDYVSAETAEKCWNRCKPQHDDLLIVCVGATTGRLTLVKNPPPMVIVRSVALVRPFPEYVHPEFIALSLKSPLGQTQVWGKVKQSAQPCLYINRLQSICLPIPPLAEQKRIVVKVNQLMALCDELETKLRQAEAHSEKLMNAAVQHVLTAVSQKSTDCLAEATA